MSQDSALSFKTRLEAAKQLAIEEANRNAHSINAKLSYGKPSISDMQGAEVGTSAAMCETDVKLEVEPGQQKKVSPVNDVLAKGKSTMSNPYAGLTARKRKHTENGGLCEEQSTEMGDVSWRKDHSSGDDEFSGRRKFALVKKPVRKPHIDYETM